MRLLTLFTLFIILPLASQVSAQGCVAVRGMSSCGNLGGNNFNLQSGEFLSQAGFRYFKSFRHFRGSHEESHRLEEGTEVINHSSFLDLSLSYGITDRFYANLILPFVYHTRSSMYEHGGNPPNGLGDRHETSAYGLADIRLGLGYWLFDPAQSFGYNYGITLGVKIPTGKFDYTDTFYNQGDNRDEEIDAVVDQSIQPGDGGTGLTLDVQGFHALSHSFMLTTNLYYLFNTLETNGVLTRRGTSEFSCPDQYAARLGVYYNTEIQGFSAFLGGRIEGVPSEDLFGGSKGYRRPGYAISIEPGLSFAFQSLAFNLNIPFAIVRNRTQSYQDKERTQQTGMYRHGDAAFADYLINLNVSYRFGGQHNSMNVIEFPEINN